MARSMRLFLIRHGETVDNVARLYAGSRDSALTNHGYQQAMRLGQHLKALGLKFTHLFSSHLQRAAKTAGLIRKGQMPPKDDTEAARDVPEVIQLRILMEQDFGDLEGKKWTDIQAELQNKPGFVAVETKEAMGRRADTFFDEHLLPLLNNSMDGCDPVVAIVSHGIFLSTLWKRFLRRLPARGVSLSSELQSTARPSLEHLGGWSNTGYLELHMTRTEAEKSFPVADAAPSATSKPDVSQPVKATPDDTIGAVEIPQAATQEATGKVEASIAPTNDGAKVDNATPAAAAPLTPTISCSSGPCIARCWNTTILTINGKDHLKGLKRTGGGVGSSRHDASQKGIESFFKRLKVD
ncbi:phosphoglycerate mutase-like protein [Macroventuria anomochaeta]|uniref:Phosphoglycerate mutase-like protein n=1 Tax=Macroventuria anomochaeta TaxID=301207 RepID=A0ACB6RQE5_9PLEO|nr:phosphoglycerate mutase-like protein [Macroventuria anomochaeta]KAF2624180.1 phosphoglycerate mutase-like protein [Macroventuria anomochaeta]